MGLSIDIGTDADDGECGDPRICRGDIFAVMLEGRNAVLDFVVIHPTALNRLQSMGQRGWSGTLEVILSGFARVQVNAMH